VNFKAKPSALRRGEDSLIKELPTETCSAKTTQPLLSGCDAMEPEAIFRLGFLDSLIPLYIFDAETLKFLEVNDAAVTQYGYTREEFLQLCATELQPDEEVARLVTFLHEHVPQMLSNGGMNKWHTCGNWKHRRRNGTIVDVYFSIHAVTYAGHPAIAASAFDMTETLRADATLRYSMELAYQLTDNLDAVFWVTTPTMSRFLYISTAYEKVWGRSRASLYANPLSFLEGIHPEDSARITAVIQNTLDHIDDEFRIICPSGEVRWLHIRTFPIQSTTGEKIRVAGITEDISVQKQAQAALENISRQLGAAQEAERRYFASELHDEIGQTLTVLKINVEAALQETPHHLRKQLRESVHMIDGTIEQVRNLCLDLRPSQLDDLGLVPTLEWYVDRQRQRTGITIHLTTVPFARQSPMIETTCFRVVQEALTNIVRHAQTCEAWVELQPHHANLELVISDQGVGFDIEATRSPALQGRSSGILGMEERVRLAGGTFELVTRPNQGVRIRVVLPRQTERGSMELVGETTIPARTARAKSGKPRKTLAVKRLRTVR
jgi:PAS domain S-box-containing protein